MRTIAIDVKSMLALRKLDTYPEGSVSKREVVVTVSCDGDAAEFGQRLNGELTKAIYAYWQQADLSKPSHYSKTRDELTKIAQLTVEKLKL